MEIMADYHTHTRHSHGRGTVAENVAAALARNLQAVGIADHGFRSWPWLRTTPTGLARMQSEVAAARAQFPSIRVLAGVEANIVTLDGSLDVPSGTLRRLDMVLAGLHPTVVPPTLRDGWHLVVLGTLGWCSPGLKARTRVTNTKAVVGAVWRNPIDIVTHPGWGLDIDTVELGRACAATGTAMEINASHGHMTVEYCRLAARQGALLALGSDAHHPHQVGMLAPAVQVARAAGLAPSQVINATGGPGLVRRTREQMK